MPLITKVKNQKEIAHAYFVKACMVLQSAWDLFQLREKQQSPDTSFGILLIHGIELALGSFILIKDQKATIDSLKKFKHDYLKMYQHCESLDTDEIFSDSELKKLIHTLSTKFYYDTIDARFPRRRGSNLFFPFPAFKILKGKLIDKLPVIFRVPGTTIKKSDDSSSRQEPEKFSFL